MYMYIYTVSGTLYLVQVRGMRYVLRATSYLLRGMFYVHRYYVPRTMYYVHIHMYKYIVLVPRIDSLISALVLLALSRQTLPSRTEFAALLHGYCRLPLP